MKKTKLVKNGDYGLTFSEVAQIPPKNFGGNNFATDEDGSPLVYEITTSELDFKNIVLSQNQKDLIESIIAERQDIKKIKNYNLPLTNKIILYGPPGTGKTLTSYCLAGSLGKKLVTVNLSTLISSKLGETAKNLDKIFARAKQLGAVLFIDEFDSISRKREFGDDHGEMKRVVNVLLQIFDLSDEDIIILAATNRIGDVDEALIRRFDVQVEYKTPNTKQISTYLGFLELSYNFSFFCDEDRTVFIKQFTSRNYSDIKNEIINLLKRKILKNKNKQQKKILLKANDIKLLIK